METVLLALQKQTSQLREDVFRLWGMSDTADKEYTKRAGILLQRVKNPIAARFVWEQLSPTECHLLYQLLGHAERKGVELATLQAKLHLPLERFATILTKLEQLLLVQEKKVKQSPGNRVIYAPSKSGKGKATIEDVTFIQPYIESADALYTAGKEFFSANSDRSTMTIDRLLTTFYYGDIEEAGRLYGLDRNNSYFSRSQLRVLIQQELTVPGFAVDILRQLDKPYRDLFTWLCDQGGKVSMEGVRKKTGYSDTQLFALLQTFENAVLAFDTFSEQKRVLSVPNDMLSILKAAAIQAESPDKDKEPFVPLAAPPPFIVSAATPLLYDLATVVGAVYQQTIEPTQAGNVPKRIANKVRPLLHGIPRTQYYGSDDIYLEMVFHIAGDLNIIQLPSKPIEGVKPRYEPGSQLQQWSQLEAVGQTKRLLDVWYNCRQWSDIAGVNYRQLNYYTWNQNIARTTLTKHLAQSIPGKWYSVSALLNLIWDKDPFVLRPLQYGVKQGDRTKTAALRTKWNTEDGELYIGILASTLHEMGMVELAYAHSHLTAEEPLTRENPVAYMLTELGAAALSTGNQSIPTSIAPSNGNSALVLQPNFELLLLQPDFPTLYSVLPFAQVNKIDVVSRLTLTRASVLRGSESGKNIEQMLRTLEEHSQKSMPQNVEYTLRDWVKSFKGAKITQVLMLEVSSDAIAEELCSSPKLQFFGFQRLGPNVVIVSNGVNLTDLRRALEKEGISINIGGDIFTRQQRYGY
ncbi:MAG TPA: helicase-associated domain-containing protein [Ktedonobacteraceae bacterium]|nr:helicase-associated domain-containing protein [Ktedonobacteraceae bacterium]